MLWHAPKSVLLIPRATEPGYYENGRFGIRIENVLLVRKVDTPVKFNDVDYLGFENVTMVGNLYERVHQLWTRV